MVVDDTRVGQALFLCPRCEQAEQNKLGADKADVESDDATVDVAAAPASTVDDLFTVDDETVGVLTVLVLLLRDSVTARGAGCCTPFGATSKRDFGNIAARRRSSTTESQATVY